MEFEELVKRSRKEGESVYQGTLLSLDPGHTTGWSVFVGMHLAEYGQLPTPPDDDVRNWEKLRALLEEFSPTDVVFEDYRIYRWRTEQHAYSEVHTIRFIGMLQAACIEHGVHYHKQMASVAKNFAPDKKLLEWGFYQTGVKHANDAIRHACHFIAFGPKDEWHKRQGPKRGKRVVG